MNQYQKIDLCGEYALSFVQHAAYVQSGIIPTTARQAESITGRKIPGNVPGNYELDLERAGLLPDPFYDQNLVTIEKMEDTHVFYSKTFCYAAKKDLQPWLVFEGIDTIADIYLNGRLLGKSCNMMIPYEFPAGELLMEGENELFVHLYPACMEARKAKVSAGTLAAKYNYETLRLRKSPHMFGWDIMPRLVSAGIYRPVRLEYRPRTRLRQAYLMTSSVQVDRGEASFLLFYEIETPESDLSAFQIEVTAKCGESEFSAGGRLWFTAGHLKFDAGNLKFWWPKGYGEPNLYEVAISLKQNGRVVDVIHTQTGVRTVRLERTAVTEPLRKGKFQFSVNGKNVFLLGTNFVPIDAFHSRDRERLPRVMDLLDDVGCNAVRCWGGNVYEDEYFYRRCDEMGILVWQDFMMACAIYPTDPEFCAVIQNEAEITVRRLRQHPCILLWSGDNECDQTMRGWAFPKDPNRNRLTRQVLRDVVDFEDPTRPYLPSSPFVDVEAVELPGESFVTEQHLWGCRDYYKSPFYKDSLCNFASEIGYHGCVSKKSMQKFLPPDKLWPWKDNDSWIIHAASPEVSDSPYSYRIELMAKQIRELFGDIPENLDDFILASQISQAEAKKFFIELFRLGKPHKTGLIWWNLIDGWPQFSDAVVDYYFEKKLAYYYIKQVQQPVLLAVDEPKKWNLDVKLINDSGKTQEVFCRVRDYTKGSQIVFEGMQTVGDQTKTVAQLPYSQGEKKIYQLEWEYNGVKSVNHYLSGNPPFQLDFYKDFLKKTYRFPED